MEWATIVALILRYLPQVASFVLSLEAKRLADLDADKIMKKDAKKLKDALESETDEEANRITRNIFNSN